MKKFIDELIEEGKISTDTNSLSRDYLREAYRYAQEHSTDESTWAGAVIVKDGEIVARGTNAFAKGVEITEERSSSPAKYTYQDHSERNAIYNATKEGVSLDGTSMYSTWIPCPACTNGIINSGIKLLVIHYEKAILTRKGWKEEMGESLEMLIEAGIEVRVFLGKIGDCINMFKKEIWEP